MACGLVRCTCKLGAGLLKAVRTQGLPASLGTLLPARGRLTHCHSSFWYRNDRTTRNRSRPWAAILGACSSSSKWLLLCAKA
jgi:hypothetical protein